MEALVLLIAELLIPLVYAALSAVFGFVGALLKLIVFVITEFVLEPLLSRFEKRLKNRAPEQKPQAQMRRRGSPQWGRWIGRSLVGGSIVVLLALLAINFLFLQTTANWVFAKIHDRSGIEISAEDVTGNLFTGRFEIAGLATRRNSTEKSGFDLQAANIAVDIDMASLVIGPAILRRLVISDVSGRYEYKKHDKSQANRRIKARRAFRIDDLEITNSVLQLVNADRDVLDVSLKKVTSAPLRSDFAVFDLFFRSNVSGTLAGQKIEISSREADKSRSTTWRIDHLPVAALGHFSTNPLLAGLEAGTLDVDATNTWKFADRKDFDIDWRIVMHGVKMRVPDGATLKQKAGLIPVAKYLSLRKKPIDLSFSMTMNEGQFKRTASLDAANFWQVVRGHLKDALVLKIKTKSGPSPEAEIQSVAPPADKSSVVKDAITRFKGLLNNHRNKPDVSE